jgi:hypothetical protein
VLTWDSRGFGESGGTATVDYKGFEGRDVKALLTWLAKQPEARLDRDPRVGMHGVSYAGAIVGHADRRDGLRHAAAVAGRRGVRHADRGAAGRGRALPAADRRRQPGLRAGARRRRDHLQLGSDPASEGFSLSRLRGRKSRITVPTVAE